jgi:NAD(P)-dependent dehydrogenase (short-subunit alcohol dehydrogenase family)
MSWSDWPDVINVHLHGSFNMSRAVAGPFREQNSGAYVHMTSTSGLVGNFGQANYTFTRMIESIPAQTEDEKRRIDAFREMTPEKIAPLAVYLGSDAAIGITGQIFAVRNNEIFLFNQPRPIRTIHRADGWTPQKIAAQLKGAFAPSFTPLERSEEVFGCDPI